MTDIERIKCGNGNVYLISDKENAVLVDTSREKYRDMILDKCRTKNVKLIVLTHGHIDHIQNAAYLSKELKAPVAMHNADYELIKDNWAEPMSAHNLIGKLILKLSQKSYEHDKYESFEPKIILSEGNTLNEYGVSATIIELPGHTKGSIGVKVGNSDLIVGDALMNMLHPFKSPLYGNRIVMEKSASKISSIGNVTIHFGHGKPVKNKKW